LRHFASQAFWKAYGNLRPEVQRQADQSFRLLERNPNHPSLHFKRVGPYWSARVNMSVRALAVQADNDLVWFWIGDHGEYERLIK
jgi:hypothetical protein